MEEHDHLILPITAQDTYTGIEGCLPITGVIIISAHTPPPDLSFYVHLSRGFLELVKFGKPNMFNFISLKGYKWPCHVTCHLDLWQNQVKKQNKLECYHTLNRSLRYEQKN